MATIYEVLEYGPIVACDKAAGLLVTINGSYLNLWAKMSNGTFDCADARTWETDSSLYNTSVSDAMDLAEDWLKELRESHG